MTRPFTSRLGILLSAMAMASLCCVGCNEEETDPDDDPGTVRSNAQRDLSPAVLPEQVEQLAADNRAFAVDLYGELLDDADGNLFCSPYSISTALAMTYAGARGETERQMADVMHFSLPQDQLHPAFNWLDLELASRAEIETEDGVQPFTLNLINSIWAQIGYPFEADYLDLMAVNYDAGLHAVDFGADPEACRQAINDWTSEHTEERIEELISQGMITTLTKLVLVNAIYFAASWASQFDESSTRDRVFHTLDGEVDVPMMHQLESYRYAEGEGYQALELPYEGGELGMVVILPDEGTFEAFEGSFDADTLDSILVALSAHSRRLTSVSLPKFSFRAPFHLNGPLQDLGMTDAFDGGLADLTGIANRPMWIAHVVHQAFIDVDEEGTEAAAATAVIIDGDGDGDPDYMSFVADRPFIFLIRDIPTNTVLFLGRLVDPS